MISPVIDGMGLQYGHWTIYYMIVLVFKDDSKIISILVPSFHLSIPPFITFCSPGTLFRFDSDLSRHTMRSSLTIPNGIGWSRDQSTLYFTHSTENIMYAYTYSSSTGSISDPRVYYHHDGPGDPDGWKMDTEGNIWQAVYGEGKVLKISTKNPERGELVGEIEVPTRNVTCPCFVGEELWITSAEEDEPEKYPESATYGGGLFRVNVGVTGIKEYKFKMDRDAMKKLGLA
jgi:sugar lactone lactonase YvrE